MNNKFSEVCHFVTGKAPVADAFDGANVASDVVDMQNYGKVVFVCFTGAGATGTSTLTVEACDNTTPSTTSAVPFTSRTYANSDVPGVVTARAASGYATTAGANRIEVCEVDTEALLASGYRYCRLKAVEVADDPVLGGILILLLDPRYSGAVGITAAP